MARRVWWPQKRAVLQLKDKGLSVAWLQERLQSLGYQVGPIDGIYGFLTEDCVCSLQRKYGLKVDGIAGPRVMEVLKDSQLQNGSVLQGIWGAIQGDVLSKARRRFLEEVHYWLTGFFLYSFSIQEDGNIVGEIPEDVYSMAESAQLRLVPVISNLQYDMYDELALETLLRHSHARWRLLDTIRRIVADPKTDGVALDLQRVGVGYGRRFTNLIREARRLATHYHKRLYMFLVPIDGRQQALPKYVDNQAWRFLPDRVILQASSEHVLGSPGPKLGMEWMQRQLKRVCRNLPAWKLMILLPVDGIAWRVEGNLREYRYLSYDDVRKLAYQSQAKIRWDTIEKVPFYDLLEDERRLRVWFENSNSIGPKLQWLDRQPISGIVVMPIGGEDSRIWHKMGETYGVQERG